MLERILKAFQKKPFLLHEAYPEIVYWKVGQIVDIEWERTSIYLDSGTAKAIIQDFDKDGTIIVRAYTIRGDQAYNSKKTFTLNFISKVAPSTIRVKGDFHPLDQSFICKAKEIFNPNTKGKGRYMDLLAGIREAMGDVDWDDL